MSDQTVNVAQIAVVNLVIERNDRRFHFVIPFGTPWEEAEQVVDDFKLAILEMKRIAQEQEAAKTKEESQTPLEAEVIPAEGEGS